MWRQVKREDDRKAMAETDKTVSEMGFELSLDAVRARYGDGWEKKAPTATDAATQPGTTSPRNFAEPTDEPRSSPDAIDGFLEAEASDWQQLMEPLVQPLQAAIDEALARGETAAELLDRLPALLDSLDADPLALALAKTTFAARLAAEAGLENA